MVLGAVLRIFCPLGFADTLGSWADALDNALFARFWSLQDASPRFCVLGGWNRSIMMLGWDFMLTEDPMTYRLCQYRVW